MKQKVVVVQCEAYGYTLTAVGSTKEKALKAVVKEFGRWAKGYPGSRPAGYTNEQAVVDYHGYNWEEFEVDGEAKSI